jgi:Arc/MetJ family transcription regulator
LHSDHFHFFVSEGMRITIDIDAKVLERIQMATGQRKKSRAVNQALAEYLRSRERAKFIGRALGGKTDYSRSNEDLEEREVYEAQI